MMNDDFKLVELEALRFIHQTCKDNTEDCELCPYANNHEPCLIYDITHSFPDNWTIQRGDV